MHLLYAVAVTARTAAAGQHAQDCEEDEQHQDDEHPKQGRVLLLQLLLCN